LTHFSKLKRRVAIALICGTCVPLPGWAADNSEKIRALVDAAIQPLMAEHDVPGMAVAVTIHGKAHFFNYGVASRDTQAPVNEATLFELGSISKTFTATLAAYARVQGKLSLADHPSQYMPQLKGYAIDKATLMHLGTYTAGGLPLQFPDEVSDDQMLNYYQQWKPDAAPGQQRQYSNPSIGLLGYITGIALHSDFSDAMENQLFPKLGMASSYIRVPDNAMASYAWGYDKANKPVRVNPGVLDAQAYGVKSTAADMIRYVQANITPSLLGVPVRRAVEGTHIGYFKAGALVQGLGWESYPYPVTLQHLQDGNSYDMILDANAAKPLAPRQNQGKHRLFNKTGSTNGFGSYVAFVPSKKIGIVLLANKSYPIPARIAAAHAILTQLEPLAH
jgi:beta-lactamase class C